MSHDLNAQQNSGFLLTFALIQYCTLHYSTTALQYSTVLYCTRTVPGTRVQYSTGPGAGYPGTVLYSTGYRRRVPSKVATLTRGYTAGNSCASHVHILPGNGTLSSSSCLVPRAPSTATRSPESPRRQGAPLPNKLDELWTRTEPRSVPIYMQTYNEELAERMKPAGGQ